MKKIKNIASSTKNFVSRHRVGIAIVTTVIVMARVTKHAVREHEEFMKEHGILDLYYTLQD